MTAKLKAVYTVSELAALARVSRGQMGRLLTRLALPDVSTEAGPRHTRMVALTAFKLAAPDLWRSIMLIQKGGAGRR